MGSEDSTKDISGGRCEGISGGRDESISGGRDEGMSGGRCEGMSGGSNEGRREDRSVTTTMVMEPQHANTLGNVHGGEIMRLMDTTAAYTANKFAKTFCVTARVDEMQFLRPLHIGDFVTCKGTVVATGKTSIEVRVTVDAEDIHDSDSKGRALEAFFTFVALGEGGHPTPVPPFVPATEREKELHEHVQARRAFYKDRREAAKKRAANKDG